MCVEQSPTMRLSQEIAGQFFKALADALSNRGVRTENDNRLLGMLEARNEHLQDMRKLVFKDNSLTA